MSDINSRKRIAINTLILYAKLIITIIVSFVTSRLVLQALGASDFGLYNVVGGIVALMNTLGTSMVATSYRYMAVEIGKGDSGNPNKVYNTVLVIHLVLAFLLLVLGETLGVFYVNNYLNVPPERISDALFVLHLSLLTTAFVVITVPMNGLIIAREKFLFTSLVGIADVLIKLGLIVLLIYYDGSRIRMYAIIMAVVQLITPLSFQIYCRIKDRNIIKWNFNRYKKDYKEIIGFTSWMLIGATAVMGQVQGAAMIINYFFGTILNAAFGLASQVQSAVLQFTTTLRQAFVPQIMKNQANNEEYSLNLVYTISRYSYLCMCIIAIPVALNLDGLLRIWLGNPPEYTNAFVLFMLIAGLINNLAAGFDASIQATGKVKKNQIGYSLINLSLLPLMFMFYKIGLPPYMNVIIMAFLALGTVVFQCYIMKELTSFKISLYIKNTILPAIFATVMAFTPLFVLRPLLGDDTITVLVATAFGALWTIISIYTVGLKVTERNVLNTFIKIKIINKFIHT